MKEEDIGYCNIWALLDNNCEKTGYFSVCHLQYLTFVRPNKVIIMQFKFSQCSVATICRWSRQINNCYVATYLNITKISAGRLCAKYYENRSMLVKTTVKYIRWAFLGTWWYSPLHLISCHLTYSLLWRSRSPRRFSLVYKFNDTRPSG